jgi:hypothetical protein
MVWVVAIGAIGLMEGQPVLNHCINPMAVAADLLEARIPAMGLMASCALAVLIGKHGARDNFPFRLMASSALVVADVLEVVGVVATMAVLMGVGQVALSSIVRVIMAHLARRADNFRVSEVCAVAGQAVTWVLRNVVH